ncbi:hypothetical protein EVAR_34642_1 [Eumeta japonica]|uniref:Uncharacterized protein n=1 Tax=Eumeta variegata TaxID=151549 RepID=A0A4C1VIR7_EUMVA|nr:hypothetical protein EVAR_34642_1 [Eumeta japonica]
MYIIWPHQGRDTCVRRHERKVVCSGRVLACKILSGIRSDPRSFKPLVAHRQAELEEHTTVKCWRWVLTKLNVADNATRGPSTDFDETHPRFDSLDFLRKNEDD